jgi:pectate lyase
LNRKNFRKISGCLFLAVAIFSTAPAQDFPIGWASVNENGFNGATGGAGGAEVTVTTFEELVDYANRGGPYIIYISGTITQPGSDPVRIEEHGDNDDNPGNKTILGLGDNAVYQGEIRIRKGARNIIIRNIKFDGRNQTGDGVSISGESSDTPVSHIWVDHCDFTAYTDGATDIKQGVDYITVSWNHYYGNARTSLLGHSDGNGAEDIGHLTVTYHHNWFDHEIQRQPRVRFSRLVHVFNNFYDLDQTALYAIAAAIQSHVLVENNYFKDVADAFYSSSGRPGDPEDPGFLVARGNVFDNAGQGAMETNNPGGNTVPEASTFYSYTLDAAADIPALVMAGAGVGKISTAEDTDPPTPDPMTWAVEPNATGEATIEMTATTATDPSGVEYYFANLTDSAHDSGWQLATTYTDTGLSPATTYTYTVQARDRDLAHNTTAASVERSATTAAPDTTPPTPDPMTWSVAPHATGFSTIEMTATTASDPAGVEYFFQNTINANHNSGWQDSPTFIDVGLNPDTIYSYRVRARDKSSSQNQTGDSPQLSATTDALPALPDPIAHWKLDESTGALAADSGPNAIDGALVNMSDASWVAGKNGNALAFDGVDDQVTIPHDPAIDFSTGPFTISFWLKQSLPVANQQMYLVKGSYDGAEPGGGKRYEFYTKDNTFRFTIDDNATKSEISVPAADFVTGDWVLVTGVRDTAADVLRIYANGEEKGNVPDNTGDIAETDDLRLGRQPYITEATQPLAGQLDDIRIFGEALLPNQIQALYLAQEIRAAAEREAWLSY